LQHVANARGWSEGPGIIFRFGQEAVIVFFLLSGFVIYAQEHARALSPTGYFLRRTRRIYPPLICALIVSTLVALDNGDLAQNFNLRQLFGTIFALQDVVSLKPGVIVNPYLGNLPLWSLSYEIAFYVVFPVILRAWIRSPVSVTHVIGATCCVMYLVYIVFPNHWALVAAYFLLWWSGAMAAEAYFRGGRSVYSMRPCFAWLLVLCLIAAGTVFVDGFHGPGRFPILPLRHFLVAAIILAILFGPIGQRLTKILRAFAVPAGFVASISYGIYVVHVPLLVISRHAKPLSGFLIMLLVTIGVSYLVDRGLSAVLPRAPVA
jgi:peptidoglycan/LPS O-acetylase OafA/YrhL